MGHKIYAEPVPNAQWAKTFCHAQITGIIEAFSNVLTTFNAISHYGH
jgi:hypothetical protein